MSETSTQKISESHPRPMDRTSKYISGQSTERKRKEEEEEKGRESERRKGRREEREWRGSRVPPRPGKGVRDGGPLRT